LDFPPGLSGFRLGTAKNTCSNVTTNFSYYSDDKLSEGFGLGARGTFRILGETDENKQTDYNLTEVTSVPTLIE